MAATVKNYPGNKNIPGVRHKIINNIPVHSRYIELFAGSGAIGNILHPSKTEMEVIYNDIDPGVTASFIYTAATSVLNVDALQLIQSEIYLRYRSETFIFIDPPYLHSTRPGNTAIYNYEMTETDLLQFFLSVRDLKCNVMIIHPVCEFFDSILPDFRKVQLKIRYNNKTSIEALYMNYGPDIKLHNNTLVGKDCWDRQRIKRKAQRTVQKILSLPAMEKQFIISELKKHVFEV